MKKKIIFILIIILVGFTNVYASTDITCYYDGYYIEIKDGETSFYLSKGIDIKLPADIKFNLDTKCPETIYITQVESKTETGWTDPENENIYIKWEIYGEKPQTTYTQKKLTSSSKYSCGTGAGSITGIPKKIPELTSYIITVLYIAVPVLLVIMGSIDLFKGITSQKDDEMKKGQQMFIKRLIVAVLIFFITVIMKFLISVIADTNKSNIADCIDCFISNDC